MHKIRVYVDTSVFGGTLDEEFAKISNLFFKRVHEGNFVLLLSTETLRELVKAPDAVQAVWKNLPPEIRNFEPKTALTSGPDGLNHYRRLIEQISGLSGMLVDISVYMEILPEQYEPLAKLMTEKLPKLKPRPLKHDNGKIFGLKAAKI